MSVLRIALLITFLMFFGCSNELQDIIKDDLSIKAPAISVYYGSREIIQDESLVLPDVNEGAFLDLDFILKNTGTLDLQLTGAERIFCSGYDQLLHGYAFGANTLIGQSRTPKITRK